jgi:hypothetical protein
MMPIFCLRELTAVARSAALPASIAVHVSVATAFLLLWGGGMPVLAGANVYEQLLLIQRALLAVLLPWTAIRCGAATRGDDLVMLAAVTATSPSRVLLAQWAGRFAALAAVVVVGLPPAIVAQQASALPLMRIASDVLPLLGLCAMASLVVSWSMLAFRSRVTAWVWASAVVGVISWSAAGPMAWWTIVALTGIGAAALIFVAESRFRYLSDRAMSA